MDEDSFAFVLGKEFVALFKVLLDVGGDVVTDRDLEVSNTYRQSVSIHHKIDHFESKHFNFGGSLKNSNFTKKVEFETIILPSSFSKQLPISVVRFST